MISKISVLVLCKNSEKHIARTLDSLQRFEEVVLYDGASIDKTESIAKNYLNVKFIRDDIWSGFGIQRQKALEHCHHDWVLWIDSDETLSAELFDEIQHIDFAKTDVAYAIRRRNHFAGKEICGTDWARDRVLRLFNKRTAHFDSAPVHEKLVYDKNVKIESLQGRLDHFPYNSLEDFVEKSNKYSELAANSLPVISPVRALAHGAWSFFRNFILRAGWRDGFEGFVISFMNGFTATLKYLKAFEKRRRK